MINEMIEKLLNEANEEATQKAFCDEELGKSRKSQEEKTMKLDKYSARLDSATTTIAELEEAVERVVQVLGQALAAYGLADDDRVHAARSMRSAFHGFSHLESGDGHPHPVDLDDSFDHLVDLLCAGTHQLAVVRA